MKYIIGYHVWLVISKVAKPIQGGIWSKLMLYMNVYTPPQSILSFFETVDKDLTIWCKKKMVLPIEGKLEGKD